jgi:hypothetical protein
MAGSFECTEKENPRSGEERGSVKLILLLDELARGSRSLMAADNYERGEQREAAQKDGEIGTIGHRSGKRLCEG